MSALKDLASLLSKTRDGILPSIQVFPPLDANTIAKDLQLKHYGQINGSRNQPGQEGDLEDSVEWDILAEIQRRAHKAFEEYRTQLDLYDSRIRQATLGTDQRIAIEQAAQAAVTDFKVQSHNDVDHLHSAKREVEGRTRECETYRVAHNIERLAHVVSAQDRMFKWLLLGIIFLVESILNGLFFAKGSEAGLIGGILQALILAFFNVGSAAAYARWGLPLLRARQRLLAGGTVTVLYVVVAVSLNLFIGHYRDMFIQHAGTVPTEELFQHLAAPLGLVEAQSLLLIIFGIMLNLLSMLDVASMDDPDPHYGALGRRRAEAESNYASVKERCLQGLMERRDEANAALTNAIDTMTTAQHELGFALNGRTRLHQHYIAHLSHLYDTYVRLVTLYREENRASRTEPPPNRFTRRPLRPDFLCDPAPLPQPNTADENHAQIVEGMKHFISAINQQFDVEVHRYETIAGITQAADADHASA